MSKYTKQFIGGWIAIAVIAAVFIGFAAFGQAQDISGDGGSNSGLGSTGEGNDSLGGEQSSQPGGSNSDYTKCPGGCEPTSPEAKKLDDLNAKNDGAISDSGPADPPATGNNDCATCQ